MDRAHDDVQKARRAQRSGLSPPPPGALTPQSRDGSRAMDRFLDSLVLYDCVGREMGVSESRVQQAIYDRVYSEGLWKLQVILSGSHWEAMPRDVCGDQDRMIRQSSHPIVVFHPPTPAKSPQAQNRAGHVIAWPNPAQPAYLNLLVHGMPLLTHEVANSITEYNGTLYLAHSAIVRRVMLPGLVVHGPATTGLAIPQHPKLGGMLDDVPCLYSPTWPPGAREFFIRPRSHGWPPQTLLSLIQRDGCHVVGASHQATARRDLEWRWSMSVAEKQLIHHLPTEMACTMYVLKGIKKHTWKEDTDRPQPICSYFLKVACLWVAELSIPHVTIMATVRSVLDWLIQCYLENNMPHYFIPNQNLIGHLPQDTCQEMASKLREVKSDLWLRVLCSVRIDSKVKDVLNSILGQLDIIPTHRSNPDQPIQEVITPPDQPTPEDIIPPDHPTPEDITPPDQSSPEDITPPDQPTPENITPPDQQTPEDITPPDQPTPKNITPPGQPTPEDTTPPDKPTPENITPPNQPTPEDITPPDQPTPEDITQPDQSTPEDIVPPDQPTPGDIIPPGQPTPGDITPPDQPTPGDITPPDQTTPGDIIIPDQPTQEDRNQQLQLNLLRPTHEDRYRQLLSGLLGCDSGKAVGTLEEATHTLGPGSEVYVSEEQDWVGGLSSASYTSMYQTLDDHISTGQPSDVIAIPDKTVLFIIDNLPSILTNQKQVVTHRASLYRYMGEIYHGLYTYYTDHSRNIPLAIKEDCKRRTERYYTEGLHLPYPDGWSDRGLSGYVHLAKFHYLTGEWGQVEGVMAKLQPLLEELGNSRQSVKGLSRIQIDTRLDLCTLPWRADRPLYCPLVNESIAHLVIIHPAVLGYYIQGRLALRRARRGQAEACVRAMVKVMKVIWRVYPDKSARVFIAVLKDYLKVYDIVQSLRTPQV